MTFITDTAAQRKKELEALKHKERLEWDRHFTPGTYSDLQSASPEAIRFLIMQLMQPGMMAPFQHSDELAEALYPHGDEVATAVAELNRFEDERELPVSDYREQVRRVYAFAQTGR
jgi:hypothetical protein